MLVENGLPPGVDIKDLEYAVKSLVTYQLVDPAKVSCRFLCSYVPEHHNFTSDKWPETIRCCVRHEKRKPGYVGVVQVKQTTPHPDDIYGAVHHFFAVFENESQ